MVGVVVLLVLVCDFILVFDSVFFMFVNIKVVLMFDGGVLVLVVVVIGWIWVMWLVLLVE